MDEAGMGPRQTLLSIILKNKDRVSLIPWTLDPQVEVEGQDDRGICERTVQRLFPYALRSGTIRSDMAKTIVAISEYHSVEELWKNEGIRQLKPHERLQSGTLLAVLGHELVLPRNPDEDNFRYLEEALDFSSDPAYRERHRTVYEWQQHFVRHEFTDAPSTKKAFKHMTALVKEIRTASERQERWRWVKRFFKFLGAGEGRGDWWPRDRHLRRRW